jgi:hypothetical protein
MVAAEPRWSADGSRIVFVMSPRGHLTRYAGDGDIYVMNADGTNIRRLTNGLDASSPAWSPDGSRIVFVKGQGQELVVMSADGSDQDVIAQARGYYEGPAWSPDGQAIAYQSSPGRDKDVTALFTIRPNGTAAAHAAFGISGVPSLVARRLADCLLGERPTLGHELGRNQRASGHQLSPPMRLRLRPSLVAKRQRSGICPPGAPRRCQAPLRPGALHRRREAGDPGRPLGWLTGLATVTNSQAP